MAMSTDTMYEKNSPNSYDLPSVVKVLGTFKKNYAVLLHYAAKGCVKYLLGKRADIVCKHTALMDDVGEVKIGTYLLTNYLGVRYPDVANWLEMFLDEAWREYERMPHGGWDEYEDDADHPVRNMILHLMPYVFCLMPERDSPYQWRNYMDKSDRTVGGCCFAFSTRRLQGAVKKRNAKLAVDSNSVLYLGPCLYREKDDENIELLAYSLMVDLESDLKTFNCSLQSRHRVLGAVFTLAPLIKDERFFREQEVRLMLVSPALSSKNGAKELIVPARRSTDFRLIELLPIDLLKSIMLSPQGDKAKLCRQIARLCPPSKKIVVKSQIDESVIKNYITLNTPLRDEYEAYVIESLAKDRTIAVMSQEEFLSAHFKEEKIMDKDTKNIEKKLVDIVQEFHIDLEMLNAIKAKYDIEDIQCWDIAGDGIIPSVTCYPFAGRYLELMLKDDHCDKLNEIAQTLKDCLKCGLERTSHPAIFPSGMVVYRICVKV